MKDSEKPNERFAFREYVSDAGRQVIAEMDARAKEKKAAKLAAAATVSVSVGV